MRRRGYVTGRPLEARRERCRATYLRPHQLGCRGSFWIRVSGIVSFVPLFKRTGVAHIVDSELLSTCPCRGKPPGNLGESDW